MSGILLIDAEQPFAEQLAGSLTGRGFSVKLLDDGKDGLDYARDNRPDLIILCVELPKMSGYSICNKLKKDTDLKTIPLIITSKEATPETFAQHKKLKTRAEDYLIKPFSDGELVEKIAALNIAVPEANGAGAAPAAADDDAFDALDSLGADLDLGPASTGGESEVKLDDAEFASLDVDAGGSLSPEDDLLAGFDEIGGDAPTGAPVPSIDELDLGPAVQDDGLNFDQNFDLDAGAAPEPAPEPAKPAPAQKAPATTTPPSPSASAADLQALAQLRHDNTDLKAKVAELEARLRAAEESNKAKDAQIAAAAGGGGASSARDVLNLKEQVRAKEKEIGALKDEVFEKEKTNVDLQEQIEAVRAEVQQKLDVANKKDVELSALNAKLSAITEERDELERQVQGRMRQAEAERDEARAALEGAKNDLDRAKAFEDKLKVDVDRAKSDIEEHKKQRQQMETRVNELESEVRNQEDRALKAYQRLKTEETVREKAKKAVEIAFTLLNGDVETGSKSADLDQLDAE